MLKSSNGRFPGFEGKSPFIPLLRKGENFMASPFAKEGEI